MSVDRVQATMYTYDDDDQTRVKIGGGLLTKLECFVSFSDRGFRNRSLPLLLLFFDMSGIYDRLLERTNFRPCYKLCMAGCSGIASPSRSASQHGVARSTFACRGFEIRLAQVRKWRLETDNFAIEEYNWISSKS